MADIPRGEGVSPLRAEGVSPSRAEGVSPSIASASSASASSVSSSKTKKTKEKEETGGRDPYGQAAHRTQGQDALATQEALAAAQAASPAILLIDDDDDFSGAMFRVLQKEGYRVRRAPDGDEGLRMAEQEPPDAILLDWMMPVRSGFDACGQMRRIATLRDVPILVLTAFGRNINETYDQTGENVRLQVQDCLEKPVEINVLLEHLSAALAAAADRRRASA
jgi:CheY-like chemotaxis protein